MDLLGDYSEEGRNEKSTHRKTTNRSTRRQASPLLLARMSSPQTICREVLYEKIKRYKLFLKICGDGGIRTLEARKRLSR